MTYARNIILTIAILLSVAGCTSHTNPFSEWKGLGFFDSTAVPEIIKQDARLYFDSLGHFERNAASHDYLLEYLESTHGYHAVVLTAPKDGEQWHHAVIYDQNNRRIKVLKYSTGSYAS